MRKLSAVVVLVGVCCFVPHLASAQNCKPDVTGKDALTKLPSDYWRQDLYQTGFVSSAFSGTEVNVSATVGRLGNANKLIIALTKQESADPNLAFESKYRGVKGSEFYVTFSDGNPVKFVADEVMNNTATTKVLGKFITTVVLRSIIKDEALRALKDSLTLKPIDMVRITLADGVEINQQVNDKNGTKFQDKLACFFKFVEEKGYMK